MTSPSLAAGIVPCAGGVPPGRPLARALRLLRADRLGAQGLVGPLSTKALMAEERRLFYVAATRARERLVVTAVRSLEADGEQPSRLVDALDLPRNLLGEGIPGRDQPASVKANKAVRASDLDLGCSELGMGQKCRSNLNHE